MVAFSTLFFRALPVGSLEDSSRSRQPSFTRIIIHVLEDTARVPSPTLSNTFLLQWSFSKLRTATPTFVYFHHSVVPHFRIRTILARGSSIFSAPTVAIVVFPSPAFHVCSYIVGAGYEHSFRIEASSRRKPPLRPPSLILARSPPLADTLEILVISGRRASQTTLLITTILSMLRLSRE